MVEALRIKEVDQMIESLQKEIHRPPIAESMSESVKIPMQDESPILHANAESSNESNQSTEVNRLEESKPTVVPKINEKFEELVSKIKDRNFELGECFETSISFVSYEDSTLTWESCANEECKKALTHGYSAIKQLVREVFGFETKIKHQACTKLNKLEESHKEPLSIPESQSTSMVEDAEIGGSASCVTNCESSDESSKEIDALEMKDEPMVQKAVELFEAKKMTIQSKI